MKATKKPVEIDYFPADRKYLNEIQEWSTKERPIRITTDENAEHFSIEIETLEGIMTAGKGDIIIKGINGEVYPCKKDIFEKTYIFN